MHAIAATTVAVALLALGCGTMTSTTNTWSATASVPRTIDRVLVFGAGMTETERRAFEDGLVDGLRKEGVDAIASYTMFSTLPDRDRARAVAREAGIAGALVARVRGVRERQTYVPGHMSGGFWAGYYGPGWGGMYSPGYVVTDEIVMVETTLWDVRGNGDGIHIWSSTTQTVNPRNTSDFAGSLAKEIVPNLLEADLVKSRRR